MKKLFLLLLALPIASHAAMTLEVKEKYSHDQKAGLYVPSPHGQALVVMGGVPQGAPLCYPLPMGARTLEQGTISVWLRPPEAAQ